MLTLLLRTLSSALEYIKMGYEISFMPLAETYEQEPESIKVWFRQRTRWVNGNIYVLTKYLKLVFQIGSSRVLFDLYYFFSVYFLFSKFNYCI